MTEIEKSIQLQQEILDRADSAENRMRFQPGEHLKRMHQKEADTYKIVAKTVERYFSTP